MAEEKKPDKKKSGGDEAAKPNLFVDAIFWILFILVVFSALKGGLAGLGITFDFLPSPTALLATIFGPVQVFSIFLSLLFLIGIIYYNVKLGELHHAGHGHGHGGHGHTHPVDDGHAEAHHETGPGETPHAIAPAPNSRSHSAPNTPDKRWLNVETRLASFSEGDWRLAILEADIILDDMLSKMGYKGEGVAEKLKQADRAAFQTLESAWEAHKVRNRIAHDGPSFHLTHEEAERVIGLFKKVFDEFYFI